MGDMDVAVLPRPATEAWSDEGVRASLWQHANKKAGARPAFRE
jgi:hypothetical protein